MNAAQLARKLDTDLFLAGYKMRVAWNAKMSAYELNFGYNSEYPHVYAYTSYFTPRTRAYNTVTVDGRNIVDTYSGDIRAYVRANMSSYARMADDWNPGTTAYRSPDSVGR